MDIAISYILRFLLVAIFFRSVLHKIRNYPQFYAELDAYQLLPGFLLPLCALLLPLLEGYCALTLLIQGWLPPSVVAATLFALYGVAMAINLVRGREDIDCGCNTALVFRQSISWALVVRNLVLTGMALLGLVPVVSRSLTALDIVTIACASVAITFVYISIEQAMANQQRQQRFHALRDGAHTGVGS
jgi:uncharacterized membrane protein YphA (DoxX/SURF4 family)